jgi:hypothetical protein
MGMVCEEGTCVFPDTTSYGRRLCRQAAGDSGIGARSSVGLLGQPAYCYRERIGSENSTGF